MKNFDYECIVVGDGPAGLSAGVYLSRAEHSNLIIGSGTGRWHYGQINQNYLGFPDGVAVDELRRRGLEQAKNYGSEFLSAKVINIAIDNGGYVVKTSCDKQFTTKSLIWCTGVTDNWPKNLDVEQLVGSFVFWCITCDGYRSKGKSIAIVANQDSSVDTIMQFKDFTNDITVIKDCDAEFLDEVDILRLEEEGIQVLHYHFTDIKQQDDHYQVCLSGDVYEFNMMFSLLGSTPRTELLHWKFCQRNDSGYIMIDDKNRTDSASFFAAGDVTNKHAHQVATAVHEGAQAGQACSYYLYKN